MPKGKLPTDVEGTFVAEPARQPRVTPPDQRGLASEVEVQVSQLMLWLSSMIKLIAMATITTPNR
jgi:hypothetical protein